MSYFVSGISGALDRISIGIAILDTGLLGAAVSISRVSEGGSVVLSTLGVSAGIAAAARLAAFGLRRIKLPVDDGDGGYRGEAKTAA